MSFDSNVIPIDRRGVVLILAVIVAACLNAQDRGSRQPPKNFGRASDQTQEDPSLRNALAVPTDEESNTSFRIQGSPRTESEVSPLSAPYNGVILETTQKMPRGGDYRASSESIEKLEAAIREEGNHLGINSAIAKPSFCSSATYLVFVSALEELNSQGKIKFEPGVAENLLVSGQHDGVGVWGRWNANGPGTARLFKEVRLGENFTSIEQAQPGDFLKIFWNDQIGSKEFGHSVVFLGHDRNASGVDVVRYWSSNKKGGYGPAEVPQSKIKRMLFSRLTHPERINSIRELRPDDYLASMLRRSSTPEEMYSKVGIPTSAIAAPIPAPSIEGENKANRADPKVGQKKED
jgi:hypothetical protein